MVLLQSGRYGYSGFMSPASMTSTTVADSSFSTVVKQPTPTPRNIASSASTLEKGPSGCEPYSLARHHYMPTAMSPVALDRYERAFVDKGIFNQALTFKLIIVYR